MCIFSIVYPYLKHGESSQASKEKKICWKPDTGSLKWFDDIANEK